MLHSSSLPADDASDPPPRSLPELASALDSANASCRAPSSLSNLPMILPCSSMASFWRFLSSSSFFKSWEAASYVDSVRVTMV